MALYLQSNTAAMIAGQYFDETQNTIQSSFEKLSSGYRINSAADDAAGLAISSQMNMQVQSYTIASQNANDAVSMCTTADGTGDSIQNLLTRMRELAVEAQNGTMGTTDVNDLEDEFQQDLLEVDRVAQDTTFNGVPLLSGAATTLSFQVGINGTTSDMVTVSFGGCDVSGLGLSGLTVTSALGGSVLSTLDSAMTALNIARASFGAAMNRIQDAASTIQTAQTNLSSALSTIQDVDVASETSALAREQVLAQAGASVLSQANQEPQLALKLLQ